LSLFLTNQALRHEGVWGNKSIDPHFLDLGTSWRRVVSFMPGSLYPRGKSPRYSLDRSLVGPDSRSRQYEEEKIPYRDSNSDPSVVQHVASRYIDCAIPAHPSNMYPFKTKCLTMHATCTPYLYVCIIIANNVRYGVEAQTVNFFTELHTCYTIIASIYTSAYLPRCTQTCNLSLL
jgi:hypothetical protein